MNTAMADQISRKQVSWLVLSGSLNRNSPWKNTRVGARNWTMPSVE